MRSQRRRMWLWRWRSNPLRRRSDVTEAWVGLGCAVALAVGAPMVGLSTAVALDAPLQRTAQEQQATRHLTDAVLLEDAVSRVKGSWASSDEDRVTAKVSWKAPDGSTRTGKTKVDAGTEAGTATTVWTEAEGRLTVRPLTDAQADANVVVGGFLAAGTVCVLVMAGRKVALRRLDRQRMQQWDAALAVLGTQPN